MLRTAVDLIQDHRTPRSWLRLRIIHHRFKVTLRLHVLRQVALSLQQQAAVHRTLLIDRYQLTQARFPNVGALGSHFDNRTVIDR
jgi:hypothetical protein